MSPDVTVLKVLEESILEDNLSRDLLYQMSNIEYSYVNNDWLWVWPAYQIARR